MNKYEEHMRNAKNAGHALRSLSDEKIVRVLHDVAAALQAHASEILAANENDLARMDTADPKYDRLLLDEERIESIANEMKHVAALDAKLGETMSSYRHPNGLQIKRVRKPLGVVGVIYEARPNVTCDVFALCFRTKNVCVLKGGSDAKDSNAACVKIIHEVLEQHDIPTQTVCLLAPDREATTALLQATGIVDVVIPRGSQGLISFVRKNATVPTIETGAGIVHTYVDKAADHEKAKNIVFNAKTRRVSVCNALDTLLVHKDLAHQLTEIVEPLQKESVRIFADKDAYQQLEGSYRDTLLKPATEEHFGTEFLSHAMSIKFVASIEDALAHIEQYSSKHSEAIVSEDESAIAQFFASVDAAVVYSNASTTFTDGAQFGLGAEIGISTQKLHARGPMALEALTTYAWEARGAGQTRK